jgi:Spy/CpxP family protein refolding chaperone
MDTRFMNSIRKSLVGIAGVALILGGGAFAGRLAADSVGGWRHFSPDRAFARIAKRLELSDIQRGQVKGVLRSHEAEILAQIETSITARRNLHAAVVAETADESTIRASAAVLGQAEADRAVLMSKIRREVEPFLSDSQKGKIAGFLFHLDQKSHDVGPAVKQFLESSD